MGFKGDKLTLDATQTAEMLVGIIKEIGGITSKKMFGGYGIFKDGKMFGMVSPKGEIFFKTGESNRAMYEKENCAKHSRMPYYAPPAKVLANDSELISWAKASTELN